MNEDKHQKYDELTKIIIEASEKWLKEFGRMHLHLEHKAEYIAGEVRDAGYRKQSENVIELPCKAGTTLYFLYNRPYAGKPDLTPRIYKTDDWHFEIDKTGIVINTDDIHSFNKQYDYYLGEAVFFTKKEAEQAIAKMKGGGE